MTLFETTADHDILLHRRDDSFINVFDRLTVERINDFIHLIALQGKPSTERNRGRREAFFDTPFSICIERARYYTESFKDTEGDPQALRMAKAFSHYLSNVTIPLHQHDMFGGYPGGKIQCSQIFPELCADYLDDDIFEEIRNFNVNPVSISDREIAELKDMAPYWRGKSLRDFFENHKPDN
ncbi:MAG: hypothetical protein JRJ27_19910, partial [Deltaproteobacteria bacterium]|nr:hypothetical protein [Deltaproteobacteria bacterium]